MTLALARKYRPRNFASVAVQSHVANTLKGAIARGRVAHAYLLCGPRGTGKTTLARVLAMALNCERQADPTLDGEPCGHCTSCERIWSGSASLDVVEIDAASNRGVDDARELRQRAMYAPSTDERYKVYIVDEAHMLTKEAWNTLLKVLEEPPPRVVFVFATTEPQKIAQAAAPVLSRVQRFDLKRIGPAEIRERLARVLDDEGVPFEDDALGLIARAADGGLRDALSLTDQVLSLGEAGAVTSERVREALGLVPEDEYIALLDLVAERRAGDVFAAVQRLADGGVDFAQVLAGLADVLRAALAAALGGAVPELSQQMQTALAERKGAFVPADLLRMLQALLEIEPQYRKSGQPQLLLESLLVRFALLDRTVALEEVLRGFDSGEDPPTRRTARVPDARGASAHAVAAPPRVVTRDAPPRDAPTREVPTREVPTREAPARHTPAGKTPTLDRLRNGWPDLIDRVRQDGRTLLSEALRRVRPSALDDGGLTLEYDVEHDTFAAAVDNGRDFLLPVLTDEFGAGIRHLRCRPVGNPDGSPSRPAAGKRLTTQDVTAERLERITSRDPLLASAVRALDLELLD